MNTLDILIIVISTIFGYIGYRVGFTKILFMFLSPIGSTVITKHIRFEILPGSPTISYLLSWLIFAVVIYLVGAMISKLLEVIKLGFFNRVAGFVLVVVFIFVVVDFLSIFFNNELFKNSLLLSYIDEFFKK